MIVVSSIWNKQSHCLTSAPMEVSKNIIAELDFRKAEY